MNATDNLLVIKDLSRKLAANPASLAMIKSKCDWLAAGVSAGAYVIFEERLVPLNGEAVVVARLSGQDCHYVGRAERIVRHNRVSVRLDDGSTVSQRAFSLRGPVVMIAREVKGAM